MATFVFVVAPLPYAVRKKVFTFLSESFIVSKLAYGLKISFMCVAETSSLSDSDNDMPDLSGSYSLTPCRECIA